MKPNKFVTTKSFTCITALTLILPASCDTNKESRTPNIIFILADDMGYNDLASYGQKFVPTPHTDQLVQEGIMFTDAHSPSAVCTPSRYGFITGTDPFRRYHNSHVIFNGEPLIIGKQESTIASLLKNVGYYTGIIGKWHLGFGDTIPRNLNHPGRGPNDIGFDYSFILPEGHDHDPQYYFENGQLVGGTEKFYKSEIEVLDRVGYKLIRHRKVGAWENLRPNDKMGATLADKADAFIEKNKNKPFFLYYPTPHVHVPFTPGPQFADRSGTNSLGDFVMEFDWMVGRIMETLDRLGLTDNTLLIVTSDNGGLSRGIDEIGHHSSYPWRGLKESAFEGGHRVPFIARWPGYIKAGSTNDETISLVDMTATFCAIANIKLQPADALDSYNILPALLNKNNKPIRNYTMMGTRGMERLVLRQGQWKLIYAHEHEEIELYKLDDDPYESNDLSFTHKEKVKELQTLLFHYFESGSSRPDAKGTGNYLENIFMQRDERNRLIQKRFE